MTEFKGLKSYEPPKHPDEGADFPKWVKPHDSHVAQDNNGHVIVADFKFHVNRANNEVTVLVNNEDEERKATEPRPSAEPDHEPEPYQDELLGD